MTEQDWPYLEQLAADPAVLQARLAELPAFQRAGIHLEKLASDYAKVSLSTNCDLAQPGMLATLVEAVGEQALRATLGPDHASITVHLYTKHIAPSHGERVFVAGSVIYKGPHFAHSDVAILSETGNPIGRGWCVFKLARRPEPPPPKPQCELLMNGAGI